MSRAGLMYACDAHGDLNDQAFREEGKKGRIKPHDGAVEAVKNVVTNVGQFAGKEGILGKYLGPIGYIASAYSMIQQRRLGKKQEKAEEKRAEQARILEEKKQKVAEANIQKQRRQLTRESYLKRSNIISNLASSGVAFPGTSVASGATGSLLTQEQLQQSQLTGTEMAGRSMSDTTQQIGSYASQVATTGMQMQGYQQLATLGMNTAKTFGVGNPFEVAKSDRKFASDYFDTFDIG